MKTMTIINTTRKLTKARTGLLLYSPFFGALGLRLKLQENNTFPTAATNGTILAYNKNFIDKLTLSETKGVIAHEIMHCALSHHLRRENRDKLKWNMACDYVINDILLSNKIVLPKDALHNPAFKGMSAETIYNLLPDEDDAAKFNNFGEILDAENADGSTPSPAEKRQIEIDWKIYTKQAAQQAKIMGSLPAELERLIKELIEPRIDWREVLRRFISENTKNDYRWIPPNRRFIHQGLYLPSLKAQEELPPIKIAIDTSGSISEKLLQQFASEIDDILDKYNTTCEVIYCDAAIQTTETFTQEDRPIILHAKGGGGTDFRPVFDYIENKNSKITCLIYLTDLQGTFPQVEPEYPTLWVTSEKILPSVPFGEIIKIT